MQANRSFPPDATSPRAARQFVGSLLGHPEDEATQMALVLTSELVTNAVLHARTPVDVRVEFDAERMRVEVADGDPCIPGPLPCTTDALAGRGLFLVQELAVAWGAAAADGGKVVWFMLKKGPVSASEVHGRMSAAAPPCAPR